MDGNFEMVDENKEVDHDKEIRECTAVGNISGKIRTARQRWLCQVEKM